MARPGRSLPPVGGRHVPHPPAPVLDRDEWRGGEERIGGRAIEERRRRAPHEGSAVVADRDARRQIERHGDAAAPAGVVEQAVAAVRDEARRGHAAVVERAEGPEVEHRLGIERRQRRRPAHGEHGARRCGRGPRRRAGSGRRAQRSSSSGSRAAARHGSPPTARARRVERQPAEPAPGAGHSSISSLVFGNSLARSGRYTLLGAVSFMMTAPAPTSVRARA